MFEKYDLEDATFTVLLALALILPFSIMSIVNNVLIKKNKEIIRNQLYNITRNEEMCKDEYVDIWYNLQENNFYNEILNEKQEEYYSPENIVFKIEKREEKLDKLIAIYGNDFKLLKPRLPKNGDDETTNTLGWLKANCVRQKEFYKQQIENKKINR